jgi:hypothetical protein
MAFLARESVPQSVPQSVDFGTPENQPENKGLRIPKVNLIVTV